MAYEKQIWENLPSTNTPLSADRLNYMEAGIYDANEGLIEVHNSYSTSTTDSYSCNYVNGLSGKVIYENLQGTDLNLVCTDTISDFDYLQFDFIHQGNHMSCIVPIINNKVQITSIGIPSNNNTMQFIVQKYTINNKTLELNIEGMVNISNTAVSYQSFTFGNQASIGVKKIIGIKK